MHGRAWVLMICYGLVGSMSIPVDTICTWKGHTNVRYKT